MSRFLETICIKGGEPLHLEWHQRRVNATLGHFYSIDATEENALPLAEILSSCEIPNTGVHRCRVIYDINALSVEFYPYEHREIKSLQCIEIPSQYDYRYKYVDRKELENLFARRGDADDILMTHDDWITDTSTANIAFKKNKKWYTPFRPLLAGTTYKRLVSEGILLPQPIHKSDIHQFEAFKIFNAMNDWEQGEGRSTSSIFF